MGTLKEPSPDDLADAWRQLSGAEIDSARLNSLVAAIRSWPTGRLAIGGGPHAKAIVASWQRVGRAVYVTLR